ncbi:MAG: hypothetical protein GX369_05790 [Euryarchaeota archaeon]|nr:hypothetical protein [Euryarchaeota archaeon]
MTDVTYLQYLTDSVKDMILTCAEDLLRVHPSPDGPKMRPEEDIVSIVNSMKDDIQSLTERYIAELMTRGMTSPNVIRDCGVELRMINERMVLDLHGRLRSKLGDDLWPPIEDACKTCTTE